MPDGTDSSVRVLSSESEFTAGVDALCERIPAFARLRDTWGCPDPWWREPSYATLVFIVFEQLISLESARASWDRLEHQLGDVTPETVLAAGEAGVREAGTTRAKARTAVELASQISTGGLDLEGLATLDDEQALKTLTAIKGIGPWTAEVYLLGALRRADLFPVADRALVVAAGEFGVTRGELSAPELKKRATRFAPWRSVAAWMLWHAYLSSRGRAAPR